VPVLLDDLAAILDLEEAECCRRTLQEVTQAGQLGKVFLSPVEVRKPR
jgi:hypothetical protein